MKQAIILLIAFLSCTGMGWAKKTDSEIRADRQFGIFNYPGAIEYYNLSKTLMPESARNLAVAYYKTNRFSEAVTVFETKINTAALAVDDRYLFILAMKSAGKSDAAMQAMSDFARDFPNDKRSILFMQNNSDLPVLKAADPAVSIRHLEMNSTEEDFGPAYCNNQVVFASTQKKYLLVKRNYLWNQRHYLNLFTADQENGQLTKTKRFPFNQNKKWHEADACFYHQGNSMAFTQDNYKGKSSDKGVNLKIFFSDKVDGKWSAPKPFYLNDKEYSIGHPSLSEDGNVMYFVSDMPGGFGGTDIYRVVKNQDGSWSKPVNLGASINTESNEMFPFWQESSNSLYFASNGRFGLGGLDMFVSEYYGDDAYEPAFNLGAPLNSEFDDFALILTADRKDGYFTSNRIAGNGDDLYAFSNSKPDKLNGLVDIVVLDKQTRQPIPNASVLLKDSKKPSDSSGHVMFELKDGNYPVSAEAVAYLPSTQKLLTVKSKRRGQAFVRDTLLLDVAVAQKIIINNIYYDYDKWDILPISALELDKVVELLKIHPDLRIELNSHTDSRGSEKYNLKLSQLRADAAKWYILSMGIDASRILAVGYGKSQLINACADPKDCTTEQHRQNRRTEIYIPDFGRGENPTQTAGDYLDGQPEHDKTYSSQKAHGSIYKIELKNK